MILSPTLLNSGRISIAWSPRFLTANSSTSRAAFGPSQIGVCFHHKRPCGMHATRSRLQSEITSPEDVDRLRFLGSPSVRVNGHDVEPGADDRETFMYACRVYRTNSGLSSQPAKEWIRAALSAP